MLRSSVQNGVQSSVRSSVRFLFARSFAAVLASVLIVLIVSIISCGSVPHLRSSGETYAQTRPEIEDRSVLTVAFPKRGDIDVELDFRNSYIASEAQLYTALYEGLFSYHPFSNQSVAGVAQKWDLSADKKTWTFKLREHARYWNGDTVRSVDFKNAWLSVLEPERGSPYSSLFDIIEGARDYRLGKTEDSSKVGIETPDDKTLIVHLVSPAGFFPDMLCHHVFSPVHPSMLKIDDWSRAAPISNGPFYLLESDSGSLSLVKNELYWDAGSVELSKIIIKWSKNGEDAAALWNSGEARWVTGGEVDFGKVKDISGFRHNLMFATYYCYIRSVHEPWNDNHVRRALALALPWENIRKRVYPLSEPAKTLVFPFEGYPEISGVDKTDVATARKMLVTAGYPGGKGLPELVFRISPGNEAARIMARTWKEQLGINVKIEVIGYDTYFESLRDDGYDVGFSTWVGDFADPYTFLQMWRRDSNLNDAHHFDNDYEKLLDRSMSEDGEARYKTLSQAEELLLGSGTVLPISYGFAINLIDTSEVLGWYGSILDIHPFKYMSYKPNVPLPSVALLPH